MRTSRKRPIWVCGSSLLSLLASAPALGAEQQRSETAAQTSASDQILPGDIVVTAQRRAELQRDVPFSITALSADALEKAGVVNIADISSMTPGVKIDRLGLFTQPAIRGVTSTAPDQDANVSIYLDGVYQPNQGANSFDLPDIERVEVLKGPQGTLFGRNATGGAIRIITRDPSFDTGGMASIGYGSFNEVIAKGYLSLPLVANTMALGLSGYYQKHDGYYRHYLTNDRRGGLESLVFRGKLLIRPSDEVKLTVAAHYIDRTDEAGLAGSILNDNALARRLAPTAVYADEPYEYVQDFGTGAEVTAHAVSIGGEIDTGIGNLNILGSYNYAKMHSHVDGDYSNVFLIGYDQSQPATTYSGELTFASREFGSVSFTAGAFYYKDIFKRFPQDIFQPTSTIRQWNWTDSESWAGFGEVNLQVTDRLTVIGGVRQTWEKKELYRTTTTGTTVPNVVPFAGSASYNNTSLRGSIRYKLGDKTNIYATYSEGFKSGGFNSSNGVKFAPEINKLYEVGLKSDQIDGLSLTLAGFFNRYTDQQVLVIDLTGGTFIQNAASSNIYGLEAEAVWQAARGLRISASGSWLHARYDSYRQAVVPAPIPDGKGGNANVVRDLSGYRMIRAPDLTLSVNANYEADISLGKLEVSGSLYYSDRVFYDPLNRISQPSFVKLGGQISLTPADTDLKLTLWGRNLTNKAIIQSSFIYSFGDPVSWEAPRSVGVSATYTF